MTSTQTVNHICRLRMCVRSLLLYICAVCVYGNHGCLTQFNAQVGLFHNLLSYLCKQKHTETTEITDIPNNNKPTNMRKLALLLGLLLGMAAEGQAQIFQVFQKDGGTQKFQAAAVDSLTHNDAEGLTTLHLSNGSKQTFPKEATDSIVWYDPSNSILSKLQKKGGYTNFLRLVQESAWWTDMMNGAKDLTVFAADDAAWRRFFAENAKLPTPDPWHTATSFEALTADQKQILLSSAITQARQISEMGKGSILRVWSLDDKDEALWTPILTLEYCVMNNITEADQRIIFGTPITSPWMARAEITDADIACTNGYIEEVSAPLTPLGTMADVIRNNGQTNIIAHMLDIVQDQGYVSELKFNPSWAGYYSERAPEEDMAAMFVPNDEEMWRYFTDGAGQALLKTYYTASENPYTKPATQEELFQQIGSIPADILSWFIGNMMMRSFAYSVPSKWGNLTDDAMELLFPNVNEALAQLDTCLLANNGMVYVMNRTYLTADFTSVAGPAYISNTCKVIKSAIYDAFMSLNYYAYLKAPQQDITFFLPSDEALRYYYDPISMKSRTPRVIQFMYKGGTFPVTLKLYNYYGLYNQGRGTLGTIGNIIPGSSTYSDYEVTNRLKDILYNHTIVNDGTQDIHSRNEYYRTFGGDVVKVVRDASGNIVGAKGSFQIENERLGIATDTPGVTECQVTESYESLSNGRTYTLNAPLVSTHRSLYSIMTNDANWTYMEGTGGETPYSEFYKLCCVDEYPLVRCGLIDESLPSSQRSKALKKFMMFIEDYGMDYNFAPLVGNTPYTAYIPTNEAVRRAIAQGLPTWDEIYEECENQCQTHEDSIRIAGKIMTLMNVVKAHFHYGMAIADQEPFQREYKSLYIDEQTLASPKLKVNCTGSGNMTVTDWKGQTFNVLNKNVFVRDYSCNKSPANAAMKGITINYNRTGVVHQIDGVLGFK